MEGLTAPEALLNTATEMEDLVRALILVRDNENTPLDHLPVDRPASRRDDSDPQRSRTGMTIAKRSCGTRSTTTSTTVGHFDLGRDRIRSHRGLLTWSRCCLSQPRPTTGTRSRTTRASRWLKNGPLRSCPGAAEADVRPSRIDLQVTGSVVRRSVGHSEGDLVLGNRRSLPRSIARWHRVERRVALPVIVLAVEEENHDGLLSLCVVQHDDLCRRDAFWPLAVVHLALHLRDASCVDASMSRPVPQPWEPPPSVDSTIGRSDPGGCLLNALAISSGTVERARVTSPGEGDLLNPWASPPCVEMRLHL